MIHTKSASETVYHVRGEFELDQSEQVRCQTPGGTNRLIERLTYRAQRTNGHTYNHIVAHGHNIKKDGSPGAAFSDGYPRMFLSESEAATYRECVEFVKNRTSAALDALESA